MKRKQFIAQKKLGPIKFIDTGSTLLNLAITDKVDGGWPTCRMMNLVGDSSSGKTFIALTSQACCHYDEQFKGYATVYDDAESADSFDKEHLFGKSAAEAIRLPKRKDGKSYKSELFQDFQLHVNTEINRQPTFYVLDSFDAIKDKSQQDKNEANIKAHEEGKDAKGSFGMAKQKNASDYFGDVVHALERTGSLLLIISQTRDKVNSMFGGATRSGGRALKFYSCLEVWMREKSVITKTVKGKPVKIGIISEILVKKNKLTGKRREVVVPIYYDYGIDDIGSCVDYLISMGTWKKSGTKINTPFGLHTREKVISTIEGDEKKIAKLKSIVQSTWDSFENSIKTNRKPRFGK